MIELKGVTKQYLYGARVLGVLDMTISDGEIIAVLGGEKSGKTSFLKVLTGAEKCEGEVLYDGAPVSLKTDDVIMVFDDRAVFKYKKLYDNLAYPLVIRKKSRQEIHGAVTAAAELLSVRAALDIRAYAADADDIRRMALARLFVRDAKVLVIDDPTCGMPRDGAKKLWGELAPLLYKKKQEGAIVVFSSTDAQEAASIADRIVVLHAGEVKQIGTYREIYGTPRSVWAAEALDGRYNRMYARLEEQDGALYLNGEFGRAVFPRGKEDILADYIGREVIIGAHPEQFAADGKRENVRFCECVPQGYILTSESGIKVLSEDKCGSVCIVPDMSRAQLFDAAGENSIMRGR